MQYVDDDDAKKKKKRFKLNGKVLLFGVLLKCKMKTRIVASDLFVPFKPGY